MRVPKLNKGDSPQIVLMLTDLGLRPAAVAAAMGVTDTYVYHVLRKESRINGHGNTVVRKDPNLHDYSKARPYIKRMFFSENLAFRQLHTVADAENHGHTEAILNRPSSNKAPKKQPEPKVAPKVIKFMGRPPKPGSEAWHRRRKMMAAATKGTSRWSVKKAA